MPIIPLAGRRSEDWGQVLACMLYPREADRRVQFVELYRLGLEAYPESESEQLSDLAAMLRRHAKGDIRDRKRSTLGLLAGRVLWNIMALAEHCPKVDASVSRACHLLEVEHKREKPSAKGRSLLVDADAIRRQAWLPFCSVAHLWSALGVVEARGGGGVPDNFGTFLAVSEGFRDFAERHRPRGPRSLLHGHDPWRVSAEVELPAEVAVPKPPRPNLDDLRRYVARSPSGSKYAGS